MFFLQAHGEGTTVSIKCEKQQAGGLADFLARSWPTCRRLMQTNHRR